MRSLYDNTGGSRPYATLNLKNGGCIHLRPSLITEVVDRKKYTLVKYGQTWLELKEQADKVRKLVESAVAIEKKAK